MNSFFVAVADLLEYPDSRWESAVARCSRVIPRELHDAVSLFDRFVSRMDDLVLSDREELYVRTFELNPPCTLEVGYHIFGETYKRGTFLAHLGREEAGHDLGQDRQLPDYLPVLLRLLALLDDQDLRASLIETCMIPAIEALIAAMKEKENPYGDLLGALLTALRSDRKEMLEGSTAPYPELNGHV